jgi:hypothetical protein
MWKESDFDRLVDGELSPEEYRRLVSSLDGAPDGWKRLGHAFLEGQAWRQDLMPQPVVQRPPSHSTQPWWMRPSPQWLAISAALMLVFALGTQIDQARDMLSPSARNQVAIAPEAPSAVPRVPAPSDSQAPDNMRVLVSRPGSGVAPTEVPIFDGSQVDPQELWQFSTSLPDDVLEKLEASGQQVVRERRLVPMHLEDGRTVVIPVERIQIVPRTTY